MTLTAEKPFANQEMIKLKRASIFPIASFLRTEHTLGLSIPDTDLIYNSLWLPQTESYLLTQAVRKTAFDDTGIVPHLLGVARNPEDTLMHMLPAATEALIQLKTQGKEIYDKTLDALLHDGPCSIDILNNLDEMWGFIVGKVKGTASDMGLAEKDGMTPEARIFKAENITSLTALKKIHSLKELVNRDLVPDERGDLIDITEELIVPVVPKKQVAKLLKILPKVFNKNIDISTKNLPLEVQILRKLGKVGNDFTRILIMIMKEKQLEQKMKEHLS